MIYYRYDLRWKDYEKIKEEEDRRTWFEKNYTKHTLAEMNEEFYRDFQKNENFIIQVTERKECEMSVHVAVKLEALNKADYETEITSSFPECDIIRKAEVTIEDYKVALSGNPYDTYYARKIVDKLGIDYRVSMFEPLPFELIQTVIEPKEMNKTACKKRAKEIMGSSNLYEEIDRIYSKENRKGYFGHPVHYMISAGDWGAAEDVYKLLIQALINNKRLVSNRTMVFKEVKRRVYGDNRYKQLIKAAEGGVVVIELNCEDGMGRFATDFHEFTKFTGAILEQQKKDTLFIFVEIMGKSLNDNDAIQNISTKADIIQITEGTGNLAEAKKYLEELVEKVDFQVEDKSDAERFLPKKETYSVTDIFNAYNAWYGSGLKNHVYKAYKNKETFKVEVAKVESKPYETLQSMIGLTEIKSVVDEIIASAKVLRVRERMGLNTESSSLHMMFSGNPGTAKTTVARLLTKILREEDAIVSDRFVECGRQDLVGKYVGWTAKIVEEKFKEALGGVLFIDEAYALVDDSNSYGAEAINCITQMMENYRNDVIVIFAGYPDKMEEFLEQNEGLRSRIMFHLDFPDYSSEELTQIMSLMCKDRDYDVEEEALECCKEIFEKAAREKNFGNGRYVRNVLEQAMMRQANRIITQHTGGELSKEEMCFLKKEDFSAPSVCKKSSVRKMGF